MFRSRQRRDAEVNPVAAATARRHTQTIDSTHIDSPDPSGGDRTAARSSHQKITTAAAGLIRITLDTLQKVRQQGIGRRLSRGEWGKNNRSGITQRGSIRLNQSLFICLNWQLGHDKSLLINCTLIAPRERCQARQFSAPLQRLSLSTRFPAQRKMTWTGASRWCPLSLCQTCAVFCRATNLSGPEGL
jgi:hypothetical protein